MPRSNISSQNKTKKEKPGPQIPGPKIQIPGPKIQIPGPKIKTQSSSLGSVLADSMVSGFGFGIGSSLAKSLFEPKISSEPEKPNLKTPDNIFKEYLECLERNEPTTNCELLLNVKS